LCHLYICHIAYPQVWPVTLHDLILNHGYIIILSIIKGYYQIVIHHESPSGVRQWSLPECDAPARSWG
jgi:hypothetical protein